MIIAFVNVLLYTSFLKIVRLYQFIQTCHEFKGSIIRIASVLVSLFQIRIPKGNCGNTSIKIYYITKDKYAYVGRISVKLLIKNT